MENEFSTISDLYAQHDIYRHGEHNDVKEMFTDLQSCVHQTDTDSQSSYSNSSEIDDDDEQPLTIHFSSFVKDDIIKSNEDCDILISMKEKKDKIHESPTINSCSIESNHLKSSNDIIDLIRDDLYKFVFMPISKQRNKSIQCRIIREKSGLFQTFSLQVDYEDNGKSLCLLTAEKQLKLSGQSQYAISVNPKFSNVFYSAELLNNNITGTSYTLYFLNGDHRQQLATILYENNFLGHKGPRKIEALLQKFDYKEDNDYYSEEQSNDCIHLHNKPPYWNPNNDCYSLQFDGKGRVTIPSVKNFQMVLENEEHVEQIVMQFSRMSASEFSCDFRYPLSLIQTFGIALSALESRMFRE